VNQLETIRALRRNILRVDASEGIDLIHAHSPSLNGVAAVTAASSVGIPVVYEMRASWEDAAVDHGTARPNGFRYRLTRASESWVLRRANAITTICEGLKQDICARGIPENKVFVIPNAVDLERFKPLPASKDELRDKYDAKNRFVIVFCGSFYSYEGLDLLIDSVDTLRESLPQILVLLAGGGQREASLKHQVSSKKLEHNVRFLGRVTQGVVTELYNLSDACVFPRHRMKLTDKVTPLKPLEAMATGAIVVASDVGGHAELISDRVNGFLFKAGDPKDLVRLLTSLFGDADLSNIRRAALDFVITERTWTRSVSKYGAVYARATAEHGKS
jgi:PEP-CTERM/exosortase A-associated glycosyltransferase